MQTSSINGGRVLKGSVTMRSAVAFTTTTRREQMHPHKDMDAVVTILLKGNQDTPDNPTYITSKMIFQINTHIQWRRFWCFIIGVLLGVVIGGLAVWSNIR